MAKKFWTASEDKYFLKTVINVVGEKSGTLNDAFEVVSKKLGRTLAGCQARYKNTIKNEVPQDVLDIISANNPRNASLKSQAHKEEEDTSSIVDEINDEDVEDEVIEVNGFEEVIVDDEVTPEDDYINDDFSDVPSLLAELITLDARRKIIKERIKKYHQFIGGVLSDK